jgi:arylsulfatase A-like enzyme
MEPRTTRRRLLQAGAGATVAAAAGYGAASLVASERRNVVLIVVDTLRVDHVFGDRARTPSIDSLAAAGVSYTNCFPEAMPTVPARNSILAGRRQFPFRDWRRHRGLVDQPGWEPLDALDQSLLSVLRRSGYWTAYATDNPFLGFARPFAPLRRSVDRFARSDGQLGPGRNPEAISERELRHWLHPSIENTDTRRRMANYLANNRRYQEDESQSFAARVFEDGIRLVDQAPQGKPFALVLDTFQPHEPWTPPRAYVDLYDAPAHRGREPSLPPYERVDAYLGKGRQAVLDRMRALHAAEVTLTDRWLGAFLDHLRARGLERDTAIVLVGDHGIYLGERGWTGKISISLHPELIQVPLIVVHPRRKLAGRRSRYPASTQDIAPTLLSLAGVDVPKAMDGADLSRPFRGRELPERPYSYGGYRNSFFIRNRRWALFGHNSGDGLRLYDLRRDPGELRDVARGHRDVVRRLSRRVVAGAGGRLPYYDQD